jgi:curved DNA-binding protein CbpA
MPPAADLYQVLQVIPDAEPEVIRAAYRALARKHHPDAGGSDALMSVLNSAWETLSDRGERARYDQQRNPATAQPAQPAERAQPAQPAEPEQRWGDRPLSARATPPRPISLHARSGSIVDFGRYAGLSLAEIAVRDSNYLEWLARTSIGRRFQPEIAALLGAARPATPPPERPHSRLFRRR